jgi:hypothetical protein
MRELKRRHPEITVEVGVVRGKEQWRILGDQQGEAAALESLRELLRPDSVLMTQEPFEVGREERDELERRIRERGGQLEID